MREKVTETVAWVYWLNKRKYPVRKIAKFCRISESSVRRILKTEGLK